MKVNYIPAAVTLTAGAVTCIFAIFRDWDTIRALVTLLVVLIVFYIIGQLAKKVIVMVMEGNRVTKQMSEGEEELPEFEMLGGEETFQEEEISGE